MKQERHFRCKWEIDVEEINPHRAAKLAQKMVQDPETTATIFDVTEGFRGRIVYRVDLRGRSMQTIRPPKPKWWTVKEERVRLVFGKRCACVGVPDEVYRKVADAYPKCEKCGEHLDYERTQVLK